MAIPFWRPSPAPQQPFKGQLFPYEYANPLSRFLYHWAGPMLKVGYSRPLVEDDLYELPPTLNARILADKIEAEFAKRLPPSRRPPGYRPLIDLDLTDSRESEATPLLGEQPAERDDGLDPVIVKRFGKRTARRAAAGDIAVEGGKVYDMALWRAMFKTIKWRFCRQVLIDAAGQYLRVTSPLLTRQILWEITTAHALHRAQSLGLPTQSLPKPHPLWFGIALSFLLFLWQCTGSLCLFWTAASGSLIGVNLRSALIDLVSRKTMRLSPKSRLEYTNGKLTTLVSTDLSTLEENTGHLFRLASQPLQVVIGIVLLLWTLGPVSFVGVAVLALSGPTQGFLFSILRKIRVSQTEAIDRRTRLLTEIIASIRAVKVYAWESTFGAKIADLRRQEIIHLRRYALLRSTISSLSSFTPVAAAISTFIAYSLLGNTLDPLRVFTALHLFNALQRPLMVLPKAYGGLIEVSVAMRRVGKMLAAEEIQHRFVIDPAAKAAVEVEGDFQFEEIPSHLQTQSSDDENTTTSIPTDSPLTQPFALRDVALTIPDGALVCVVGRVGTGKSALLSGLINEVRQVKGQVIFSGSVSYVPQQAWVQSGSVRENLTFSTEDDDIDMKRLDEVIDACALRADIDNWAEGVLTTIGERGITLSGGQRQRICLARAAYSKATIVLLDDPLSAVDAHVGHHLLANCILNGPLAHRTRILVTHNLEVLPSADVILVMDRDDNGDGRIVQQGSYSDLLNSNGIFQTLIQDFGSVSHQSGSGSSTNGESEGDDDKGKDAETEKAGQGKGDMQAGKLMIEEERNIGSVTWSCYFYYLQSVGSWVLVTLVALAFILEQAASVSVSWWLGMWSGQHLHLSTAQFTAVYGGLGAFFAFMMTVSFFGTLYAATRASITMFNGAWNGVMRTSVGWHDRTPMGRITNRLTKDISNLDDTLGGRFYYFVQYTLYLVGGLFLISYTYPVLSVIFIPIAIYDYLCLIVYRKTAREIKRIDSNLRSHIYSTFSEQLSGLTVIRAFARQGTYEHRLQDAIYHENRAHILTFFTNRWIGARLEISAQAIVLLVALFGVKFAADVDAARFGTVLTYIIASTSTISSIVTSLGTLEVEMNNVERIKYYNELEREAPALLPSDPPISWPSKGELTFSDVSLRYRPELPMILKNVSFNVRPGEKVGIIGRTGAGKSSLAQALFRTVEICGGKITVDGVNLASIGLDTLRSRLGIIPQDAFLFGGSVRDNLDPAGERTDQDLNDALSLIHHSASASSSVREKFVLDAQVQDGGANFSAGERQLLALMRALVRNCKVLLLDEATSSVDPETDALIQRIIQTSFSDVTLISIAHRLQTVAYYDRILVMDQGEVAEFDTPLALFDQRDSIFRSLCDKKQLGRADLVKIREEAALARRGLSAPTDLLD